MGQLPQWCPREEKNIIKKTEEQSPAVTTTLSKLLPLKVRTEMRRAIAEPCTSSLDIASSTSSLDIAGPSQSLALVA